MAVETCKFVLHVTLGAEVCQQVPEAADVQAGDDQFVLLVDDFQPRHELGHELELLERRLDCLRFVVLENRL